MLTDDLAAFPIQAYLFAQLISVFNFYWWPWFLQYLTNWWCLMFTVLAIGVGVSYFILGWSANTVSYVSDVLHFLILSTADRYSTSPQPTGKNISRTYSTNRSLITTKKKTLSVA